MLIFLWVWHCNGLLQNEISRAATACSAHEGIVGLIPRLCSPAFYRFIHVHGAIKSWGVESGNEARHSLLNPATLLYLQLPRYKTHPTVQLTVNTCIWTLTHFPQVNFT